jgi:hypothetical protein
MNSKKSTTPSGSRSFSTSARSRLEAEMTPAAADVPADIVQFQDTRAVGLEYPDAGFGHKFSLPDLSKFAKTHNFKKRYDPVVDQVTKSLMRDGKLSRAQAVCRCVFLDGRFSILRRNFAAFRFIRFPHMKLGWVAGD